MVLEHTAARSAALLSFLRREMGLSAGLVKRLKWQNALFLDGSPVHTDAPVRPGQQIRVVLEEQAEGFLPEPMPLEILYEDEFCIALDKPAGILVHPSPQRNCGTLANGLLEYYRQTGQRCGIHPVSRLDRDTFGVILFAKNAHAHEAFRQLHRAEGLEKVYQAAVFGCPPEPEGRISLPIYKLGNGSLLRVIDPRGQPAETQYRLLDVREGPVSLLELRPLTGRTHQLRVHCRACGFPILGDPQYASAASRLWSEAVGLDTQQLCAVRLAFRHPLTGSPVCVESRQRVHFSAASMRL